MLSHVIIDWNEKLAWRREKLVYHLGILGVK